MTHTDALPAGAAAGLSARLAGALVVPSDPGYDEARTIFNAAIDRRPAMVARPGDAGDVAVAVRYARDHGIELGVRGGGHGFAGHALVDGGLVLDLSAMGEVGVDPGTRTGWAQGGATAGAYTEAAGRHGLATSFGDTAGVGLGGLTLGGGHGWLARRHGLTIDHLLAVELVTADGELLRVDAEHHPDLFWALRGGGGNFGVVTRLEYRLHEVGTVVGGMLALPAEPAVLAEVVEAAAAAPDELTTIVQVGPAPPMPAIPGELHGRLVVFVMVCWSGTPAAAAAALAPLRAAAPVLVDAVEEKPYPAMYEEAGGPGDLRLRVASRSTFLDRLDEPTAAAILERLTAAPTPVAGTQFRILGGAVGRVPVDATAFAHRDRRLLVTMAAVAFVDGEGGPDDGVAAREAWADSLLARLRPAASGAFVSFMGDEGPDRVREAFPHGAYERLLEVKRRYDPANLFRSNHNLPVDA